jgi:dCMP deaminase
VIKGFREWLGQLTDRPDVYQWSMMVALAVGTRGECTRRRVGAIIVDQNGRIAGAGYNGTRRGGANCLQGACPRAASGVASGSSYDTGAGACHAAHAELNALLDVSDKNRLRGSELYVTATPCEGCLKILRNTEIYRITYLDDFGVARMSVWPHERQAG